MSKSIGDTQSTAEGWEIGAALINSIGGIRLVFKDENGVYHTVEPTISQVILNGEMDAVILSGEIVEPQPNV